MKRKAFRISAIGLLLIFCSSVQSYAYGKTWMGVQLEQSMKAARLRLGPFRIRTVLYLTNAGHDSNIYRTPYNPTKDYSFTAGPGFYIYLPLKKKIVFTIFESPQYVYFLKTDRARGWNNNLNGQVNFVFNRLFMTLRTEHSAAQGIWNSEIDIRSQRKEDSYEGSLLCQLSKKTSLFSKYSQYKYEYKGLNDGQSNLTEALNRTENRANLTMYYQLSYRTRTFLNFEYGFFNFKNPLSLRDSKSYALYSGLEFSTLGVFRGKINLGYKVFDPLKAGIKDYRGIVGNTGVSFRFLKPLSIRANYRRDVEFSVWYDNAYFIENIIGGGASLYLFRNIRLDYDYYLGRNNYPSNQFIPQGLGKKRRDNFNAQSVGLYFRLKKNVGLGVTVNQWIRDSNLYWENSKRTFIGGNLTYDF